MRLASISLACLLLAATGITLSQDGEARSHLLHEFGGPYFVSREKVQKELKLSDEQRQKLEEKLSADLLGAGELVKKFKGGEREKLMQTSSEKLVSFLQVNLTAEQFRRFQQLELQYELPATMLRPEIIAKLSITGEQRQKFMGAIQGMKKEIGPLMQQARSGGNPQKILAQVTRLRLDCQEQIVAMLNETQRSQWEEMTGSPFIIW